MSDVRRNGRFAPTHIIRSSHLAAKSKRSQPPNYALAPRAPDAFPGEQKYVPCPASEHLHQPRAMLIYPTAKTQWPAFVCGCGVKGYASGRFEIVTMGLVARDFPERGIAPDAQPVKRAPPPERGDRYVVCPFSFYLHTGLHAARVQKGPKAYHCQCGCGSNWFMGRHVVPKPRWTEKHGYTLEQILAMGATAC
jgi:hypothetical protein